MPEFKNKVKEQDKISKKKYTHITKHRNKR